MLPKQDIAETYENRVAAVLETAWAYWHKNPYVQYDQQNLTAMSRALGVRNASNMNNTPEMAGPQRNIYHVCSYLAYGSIYHAFDYALSGGWEKHWVRPIELAEGALKDFTVLSADLRALDETQKLEKMEEFRNVVQPGDILLWKEEKLSDPVAAVHNGETFVYIENGELIEMTQENLDEFIMYQFFIALRPSQAI